MIIFFNGQGDRILTNSYSFVNNWAWCLWFQILLSFTPHHFFYFEERLLKTLKLLHKMSFPHVYSPNIKISEVDLALNLFPVE